MLIKKHLSLLSALLAALSLIACQQSIPTTLSNSAQNIIARLSENQNNIYYAAYKSKSTAAFQVKISTAESSVSRYFTILNSTGGTAAKGMGDVLSLRVFLYNSSTPPSGSISPFNGQVFTINTPSAAQTIVFDNVPANSYYVCAAAFDSSGTFDNGTNLTDKFTSTVDYAEGLVFCSNSGGETGDPGRVTIDAAYMVTGTDTLQVPLQLQSIVGATIDSSITVIDGS